MPTSEILVHTAMPVHLKIYNKNLNIIQRVKCNLDNMHILCRFFLTSVLFRFIFLKPSTTVLFGIFVLKPSGPVLCGIVLTTFICSTMQNKNIQRAILVLINGKYNNDTLHNVSVFAPFKNIFFLNMRLAFYTIILVATSVARVLEEPIHNG